LIGESLDHQRVRWIHIVVMESDFGAFPAGFADGMSEGLALQQIQVQGRRKYKDFSCFAAANCSG
jgi:hypothetical protein